MRLTLVRSADSAGAMRCAAVARVNLLPEAARVRLVRRARTRFWCGTVAAAALVALTGWRISTRTSSELEAAQRQLAAVQGRIHEESRRAAALAARFKSARERRALLAGVCASEPWAPHLARLALAVPHDVYLTQIAIDATRKPAPPPADAAPPRGRPAPAGPQPAPPPPPPPVAELRITGVAAEHAAVTTFVANLQQAGCFRSVELTRSAAAGSGAARVFEFAILCRR